MADFENGKEVLKGLAVSNPMPTDRNEASTRFHVIDPLLRDVLCWHTADIHVEVHDLSGFSDYELGRPPRLLVEAKRDAVSFVLPAGWQKPTATFETLATAAPDVMNAVKQALDYALPRGIPLAAVSNGSQLVAFLASRQDGVPPLKGKALVYRSLDDMLERFHEFWDALSPVGVAGLHLARLLHATALPTPPDKLSARIVGYPRYKNRNPIATDLQILGGIFLEDLARDPSLEKDFLVSTYCASGALSQYAMISKELLQARYSRVFEQESGVSATPATTKHGLSPELRSDVLTAGLSRRPILLVGDVGVGKTMFVRHLINVAAREALERAYVLYIDFGHKPALAQELRPYVVKEIERQLLETYRCDIYERNFVRGVYHGDLLRFARGTNVDLKEVAPDAYKRKELEYLDQLQSDAETHLKACLTHVVKAQTRQVVLFLDNVDQRSGAFQEEVFLIAQSLADQWPLTAFVALRPETFSESRTTGSLAAYQPRVFTIDPPRVDQVLHRRLAFAKRQLETTGRLPSMSPHLTLQSQNLTQYIAMLLRAFTQAEDIVAFVDNMSGGNIRAALDFVSAFVGSGHVDSAKILRAEEADATGYTLPLHEFLRAVAYGDYEHFCPEKSPLLNVYDISARDGREHFLVPLIIMVCERMGRLGGADGYVATEEIYRYGQGLGFQPQQVTHALDRCVRRRLLATCATLKGEDLRRLRVTTVGAYTVKRLMGLFTYLDAVAVDTPIVDASARAHILDVHTIGERLTRCEAFLGYLDLQWSLIGNPQQVGELLDWPTLTQATRSELKRIRDRVDAQAAQGWNEGMRRAPS